ncbi:MAG TPA: hypothetical protein VF757_07915 [Sphingomicrobium sp.]
METDLIYYRRRAAEESAAAAAAEHVKVKQVHLELARRYAERITALEAEPARATLHLVTAA